MRIINLNGYIDEEVWYGDEITPGILHDQLFAEGEDHQEPVRIILNSYGGSCNAAVRMFDDVRAYPGKVHIIVSGTAASAATVLAMAADTLEMTPGSMWMIHDPSVFAFGNEHDLNDAIRMLQACKDSILNVYARRCHKNREDVAAMMTETTWMDSHRAYTDGFVDGIVDMGSGIINSAYDRTVVLKDAQAKVNQWIERSRSRIDRCDKDTGELAAVAAASVPATDSAADLPEATDSAADSIPEPSVTQPVDPGVPAIQLHKRLDLIKPRRK